MIICSRNRIESLQAALAAFEKLPFTEPWELVVVDNGSTDGTGEWLASFAATTKLPLKIVAEPTAGLSRARNAGVAAALGRILAFTDDDCYPAASYLNDLLLTFDDKTIDYVGGRVLLHDPQDLPITIKTSAEIERMPPFSFLSTGVIHGANMAFRREVFAEVGLFDPLLGAGGPLKSAEDIDLASRASWHGFSGAYCPRPTVSHHHRRRGAVDAANINRMYDFGRGAYFAKLMLNKAARRETVKHWYWNSRPTSVARLGALLRELHGASVYIYWKFRSQFEEH